MFRLTLFYIWNKIRTENKFFRLLTEEQQIRGIFLHGFGRREYNILYRICSRIFTGSILHRRWPFWKGCGAAGFGRDTPDGADACFSETVRIDDQQRFCIAPAASDTRGGLRLLYGFCWPFRYIEWRQCSRLGKTNQVPIHKIRGDLSVGTPFLCIGTWF